MGDTYEPIDIDRLGVRRRALSAVSELMQELIFDVTSIVRDAHFAMDQTARMFDNHGLSLWRRSACRSTTAEWSNVVRNNERG